MRQIAGWMAAALATMIWTGGAIARPWPDSSAKILVFGDQFPEGMTAAQRQFAAANFVGTQKMRRSEIQALRAYNANFLCLHYQLALGCGNHAFIVGDEWSSDWTYVNSQESWFLHNPWAQRVHQTQWDWDVMDVTYTGGTANSPFPSYWIASCLDRIQAADNDGCFADSFTVDSYGFGQSNPTHPWLEDTGQCMANWIPSLMSYGGAIRAAFDADGRGFKFIPNMGGLVTGWDTSNYGVGHGLMIESFAFWGPGSYFDPADWQLQMDRGLALARSGKIVICQSYPSQGSLTERMFALASYLLIKCSKTYFNMLATDMVAVEYYPEYRINLGAAQVTSPASLASLYYAPWGVYRRMYAGGMALVNPGDSTVNIASLGATYYRVVPSGGGAVNESGNYGGSLSYQAVSSLSLPAHSGAVLTTSPGDNPGPSSGPDFTITGLRASPYPPRARQPVTLYVTIRNAGNQSGDAGHLVLWSHAPNTATCGQTANGAIRAGTLRAGQSKTITISGVRLPAPAASQCFRAFIDGRCVTGERDEGNNQVTRWYSVR